MKFYLKKITEILLILVCLGCTYPLFYASTRLIKKYGNLKGVNISNEALFEMDLVLKELSENQILFEPSFFMATDFQTYLRARSMYDYDFGKSIFIQNLQRPPLIINSMNTKTNVSWISSCRYEDCINKKIIEIKDVLDKEGNYISKNLLGTPWTCIKREKIDPRIKTFSILDCSANKNN